QTGIAIAGWGIAVDAVVSDFLAGAAERLVVEGAQRGDLLWVEGQGAILHPIYSGVTLGLIHGSAPHLYVLCHEVGRTEVEGDPTHSPVPSLTELVDLHERMSLKLRPAKVACIALNTAFVSEDEAREAVADAEDGGAGFFYALTDLGMTENRVAVLWDPARPTTIVDQAFLDRSLPQARAYGIDVIFAIYPAKARALVDTPNGVQLFAQFAAKVAARYPQVTKIVCLNEGNQPRFHHPQFDAAGNGIAGAVQEAAMAACYDALMAVNPNIDVTAYGSSPRGTADFEATSN